jgi:N-acetylglutamate synthase-like GNAT family acetyltransferase
MGVYMGKNKKVVWKANIRLSKMSDLPGIREISNLTWDGDDYLGNIAEEWIKDGHFYIAEYLGKIVGTTKMTLFPGKVAWLEGLRVHPKFQKHGIGHQLNDFLMAEAFKLIQNETVKTIEFCTYYKNTQSISLAEKAGFKAVDKLFVLSRTVTKRKKEPKQIELPLLLLKRFGPYLPYGWKSIQNTVDGRKWILEHVHGYRAGNASFYVGGVEPIAIIPVMTEDILMDTIPALNYLFRNMKEMDIIVPESQANMIPILKRHRFHFWCKPEEPNMLIFRWFPL